MPNRLNILEEAMARITVKLSDIKMEVKVDESPDLSFLGEYSDKPAEHHIDREERGDKRSREFRYFNLGCGDAEYIEQDYKRMEAYYRGDWYMTGVVATVDIRFPGGRIQTFDASLWGIESDSEEEYRQEVFRELREELVGDLDGLEVIIERD